MLSSWILPRWYIVSIAPKTPPLRDRASNSCRTASSTKSVNSSTMNEPCIGFSVLVQPLSLLTINWIASALLTDSSVGVVIASSYALVCSEFALSWIANRACKVVRISLKSISCACRLRPLVWIWYFNFWLRSSAPYRSRIATAQILRATLPITVYSGSKPFEKKKDRLGANSATSIPLLR